MCSVRNEALSEWRANLRMRFIKRKSLQTGQKSRWRKCGAKERCSRPELLEPRFWMVSASPTIRELTSSVNTIPSGKSNGTESGG